ncbi:MAG TPA: serine hydrolase domain-containing protein [Aquella sp.]|nr:serine hydrolase domain-containing protein [Aquella sp.]
MVQFILRKLLILFSTILSVHVSANNLSIENVQDEQSNIPIQQFANRFLNQYKESDGFTAVSITAQCKGLNRFNPVTVYAGTIGRDDRRSIQDNSLWQIGSNTKSFTSIVLLQLEAEHPEFSIEDSLGKWFPEYSYWQDSQHKVPTIHQLMNMTSGIPDDMTSKFIDWYAANPYGYLLTKDMIDYAPKSLSYSPGSSWNYSNTNYQILSLLIGRITQKDYNGQDPAQVEITNRIINKLRLHNTYYVTNLPTEYTTSSNLVNGYLSAGEPTEFSGFSLSYAAGSGNIISTTTDMNEYYHALYQPNKLLTPAQFQKISSWVQDSGGQNPGQPIAEPSLAKNGDAYGLGIQAEQVILSPERAKIYPNLAKHIGNYKFVYYYVGSTFGFNFYYLYNPKVNEYLVIGVNSRPVTQGNGDILDLVYDVLNYLDVTCN